MSELERLTEALGLYEANRGHTDYRPIVAAARRYADLLTNGQRVEWCETHRRESPTTAHCDAPQHIAMEPCRIASRLLVPSTKEEA